MDNTPSPEENKPSPPATPPTTPPPPETLPPTSAVPLADHTPANAAPQSDIPTQVDTHKVLVHKEHRPIKAARGPHAVRIAEGFSLSKKESRQLIILLFALVACTGVLFSLRTSAKLDTGPTKDWEYLRPPAPVILPETPTIPPITQPPDTPTTQPPDAPTANPNTATQASVAFVEQPDIFASTQDDAYLELPEFFYLIHQMKATSNSQILAKVDMTIGWERLSDLSQRSQLRGKIALVRGGIMDLRRKELSGDLAKQRGLVPGWYWLAMIYDTDNHVYLVVLTEFPEGVKYNEPVEIAAAFYKVWQYQSENNRWAKTAVFVGNSLHKLPLPESKGAYQISWTTLLIFSIILGAIAIAFGLDHYQSRKLLNRNKKKLSK